MQPAAAVPPSCRHVDRKAIAMTRALTRIAVLAGVLLLAGCASGTTPELGRAAPDRTSITTRGVGTVAGTPDTLTVVLGVQTRAASAADALADNNTRAGGLLDVLRGRGVADKDLRTSGLSISPTFEADGRISGYEVTNEVTATLRDIAGAGALVDAAAQAAGDAARVQQIAFGIDDDAQPRAQARADAVRQAVTQAHQLADAADVGLGPILSITEVSGGQPPVPVTRDSAAAQAAVPIQPGTQDVSVTVEVVHAVAA
jgi:uncharacterized protein